MVITGMAHFKAYAKENWYNNQIGATKIDLDNVFIVWSCKTLQNYKCLASTTVSGDGIYAEYHTTAISRSCTKIFTTRCRTLVTQRNKED